MKATLKSALCTAGLLAFALAGGAQAQVVNVDINDSNQPTSGDTYSGVGAAPDTGTFWNTLNIAGGTDPVGSGSPTASASSLTASDGSTPTGISVSLNAGSANLNSVNASYFGFSAGFAPALLSDFAYQLTTPYTFTIGGLVSGDTYNLYLYAENGSFDSGGGSYTIGSTTLSAVNSSSGQSGFVSGVNYVEFVGLIASGTSITGTVSNVANGSNEADYLDGLQIDNVTPATPEPSSTAMLLLGAGFFGLLIVVRRAKSGQGLR